MSGYEWFMPRIVASLYFLILSPCADLPGSNVKTSPVLPMYLFLPTFTCACKVVHWKRTNFNVHKSSNSQLTG